MTGDGRWFSLISYQLKPPWWYLCTVPRQGQTTCYQSRYLLYSATEQLLKQTLDFSMTGDKTTIQLGVIFQFLLKVPIIF